ncbi:MAG TPA: COX15/CtaA family protein [Flavisolibacter sp.]|nr:COX15/CtaA family protein [Flavisolibacter sp.]
MDSVQNTRSSRPVAIWIMIGVAMIIIQIILGGITRLTGSGLSITEWDLGRGTLPPLNEQQWLEAFEKYKGTNQFRQLNSGFTLPDFKFIFFWEWFHRLWGRLIGVVFAIPFIIFLVQRRFKKEMVLPLIILFLLGALQGAVGWIMVASGLTGDAIYVRPTRLAMHFVLALVLLVYTYWFALQLLTGRQSFVASKGLKRFTWVIIGLLFVQLFYGALMAGYKAAFYAPTWPSINGEWVPSLMSETPGSEDGLERKAIITTHFIHRGLAYLLVLLVLALTIAAARQKGSSAFRKARWAPFFFVLLQTTLGILTVLSSTGIRAYKWNEFEWMAQLHQLVAIFLLLSLVHLGFLLSSQRKLNS